MALLARDIRYDALTQAYDAVWAALFGLPDRDPAAAHAEIRLDDEQAHTQRQIAARWGVTHARVEQIEARALRRMHAALARPEGP